MVNKKKLKQKQYMIKNNMLDTSFFACMKKKSQTLLNKISNGVEWDKF